MTQRRPIASNDLPWFFGSGPTSFAGDCGLKSNFGSMIEANKAATVIHASDARPWMAKAKAEAHSPFDAEEEMADRLQAVFHARQIKARLDLLNPLQVAVLRLAHSGTSLPDGIDSAACVLHPMRELVMAQLSAFIEAATQEHGKLMSSTPHDDAQARRCGAIRAQLSRWTIELDHVRESYTVPHEIARRALHDALPEERAYIQTHTSQAVSQANQAYESTTLPHDRPSRLAYQGK